MSAAIRHFETVATPTLSISMPEEFLHRRVEVIVLSCDDDAPAEDWDCEHPESDFLATIDASCCGVDLVALTGDDQRFQYLMEKYS